MKARPFTVAAFVLLASCQSPQSRINKNLALFRTYPHGVQQKIQAGEVAVGFTEDMVLMAKGEPDRKYPRPAKEGNLMVWAYLGSSPQLVARRPELGPKRTPIEGEDVIVSHPYEKTRVIFKDGVVAAVEELKDCERGWEPDCEPSLRWGGS